MMMKKNIAKAINMVPMKYLTKQLIFEELKCNTIYKYINEESYA